MVVNWIGELASPPARGVTVCGIATLTSLGAVPTQETEKTTGALNPPIEFTVTDVPAFNPGIVEMVSDVDATEKSGKIWGVVGVTGARTPTVPETTTGIWVMWETTPFVAVTMSVYVPVEGVVSAVRVRVVEALPPAGTVTGLERLTVTPDGAGPDHSAERLTVELSPSVEERRIAAEPDMSGIKVTAAGEVWMMALLIAKSGTATGARTVGVPTIVTVMSVE